MDDPRPDDLLERCGRLFWRVNAAIAWTDGIGNDVAAKTCSRNGSAAWKNAKPLREQVTDEDAAAGYYVQRCRRRNPAVVASRSGFDLVEYDGDRDELDAKHDIPRLPETLGWQSRRGPHRVYRTPAGEQPIKVQVDADGVMVQSDGYLAAAPAWRREHGVVYELNDTVEPVRLPRELRTLLQALGSGTRTEAHRRIAAGEKVAEGQRRVELFWFAVGLLRDGLTETETLERTLAAAREQCAPPLSADQTREQFRGAVKWVATHPTETERARAEARRILDQRRSRGGDATDGVGGVGRKSSGKAHGLFLPFADVRAAGPVRWVWREKIPESAVSLVAGRPKGGKSLFSIWLAAQLSHGKLEGSYFGKPAKTLLIAAEDPVDTIVKARLIAAAADESQVGTLASRPSRPSSSAWGVERGLDGQEHQEPRSRPQEIADGLDGLDGHGALARRIVIPDEYPLLEEIVVEHELALIVLDPINSFLSRSIDAHRDVEIRRVLDPLAALCARRHFAAVAIVHLNRRTDNDVLNRITGSGGYSGSARSILTFGRHPENDLQRVIASEGNWQKETHSELFEIREVIVFPDAPLEDQTQPALVHVGSSDLTSSDLVDQLNDDRSALDQAKEYLLGELALGPVAVADLRKGAEATGVSWPTVERAKRLLGVQARRVSAAGAPRGSGRWEWFLELEEQEPAE